MTKGCKIKFSKAEKTSKLEVTKLKLHDLSILHTLILIIKNFFGSLGTSQLTYCKIVCA